MIVEMCALWLVEDCVISCYNHPARGDYNTGALIFKMAAMQFLGVSEEEKKKRKYSCSDNHPSNNYIKANYSPQAQHMLLNNPLDFVSGIIPSPLANNCFKK